MRWIIIDVPDNATIQDGHKEEERFLKCYFEVEGSTWPVVDFSWAEYWEEGGSLYKGGYQVSFAQFVEGYYQNFGNSLAT